ncbi:Integral membrane protein of the Golgi [Coemansia spiralis]|uniref:Integral membrane protein of the Golgi n=1 Tax=Coemansia spiralis TaxID=417178 RepID=A0A9W8GG29_9FUNG|nr:Integral membrane protein of the Golgi [Coemansia spiralis]
MVLACFLTDLQLSPQLLFDSRLVRGDTVDGWVIGVGLVCMGFANILPLVYMVERSRLCIDFSLTFFTLHLLLTWWHQGSPPSTLLWWLVVGGSGSAMAFGGRAACMRRELLPIAIRNFMPSHPREAPVAGRGERDVDAEEMELETRAAGAGEGAEVLFDAAQLEDHAGGVPSRRTKDSDEGGADDWGSSSWGEDDDDGGTTAPAQQPQPPQPAAPAAATTTASSKPLVAPKGGKRD